MNLHLAQLIPNTDAEGPGRRFAVWVQGCTIRCKSCCNPEMFARTGGFDRSVAELTEQILSTPDIEGITILGGEPMEQPEAVAELARNIHQQNKSVVIFSGYTLEEIKSAGLDYALAHCDTLVDGRYDATQPESQNPHGPRRWLGSFNQRIHYFSTRYQDADFRGANTVELRMVNGKLQISGWPGGTSAFPPFRRSKDPTKD